MIRNIDVPFQDEYFSHTTRKTYLITTVLIMLTMLQWYLIMAFITINMTAYSTILLMAAFFSLTIFNALPSLRRNYPYNYSYMIFIVEMMVTGIGALTYGEGIMAIGLLSLVVLFAWFCLVLVGAIIVQHISINMQCFITTIFLNFMVIVVLLYMILVYNLPYVLHFVRLNICYTVVAMTVYQSMLIHEENSPTYRDDAILTALLLYVDFTSLFIISLTYIQEYRSLGRRHSYI